MKVLLSKKELSADSIGKKRKKTLHNRRLSTLPLFLLIRDPAVSFVFLPSFLPCIDRSINEKGEERKSNNDDVFSSSFFCVTLTEFATAGSSFTPSPYSDSILFY